MEFTPSKLNMFTFMKLPAAWMCGVRYESVEAQKAVTRVRHRWINQNPFRSMFWAVQGMAAEMATGILVMMKIRQSGKPVSMLVVSNKASFTKKATGMIRFTCEDGAKLDEVMEKVLSTGEGQTLWMRSVGKDQAGDVVAEFEFQWSLRRKG